MSKIKVNELESKTENTNVKLTPVGTGVVTVKGAGGNDGTLELKTLTGNNGVKLKSPPHSAGQSYTLNLPNTNIEAGKFLKVTSKTGSGSTATGQLQCATLEDADLTQLNASNLTSGTLPNSVLPASLPATSGASLKLESHTVITNTNTSYLEFNNLVDNSEYILIIKKLRFSTHSSHMRVQLFGSSNNQLSIAAIHTYHYAQRDNQDSGNNFMLRTGGSGGQKNFCGVFDWNTREDCQWASFMAIHPGREECGSYGYFGTENQYSEVNNARLYGIRFSEWSGYNITDADVLLYRFLES